MHLDRCGSWGKEGFPAPRSGIAGSGSGSRVEGSRMERDDSRAAEGRGGAMHRDWHAAANVVAQTIRKLSGAGRFAVAADVLDELAGLGLLGEAPEEVPTALDEILVAALTAHPDLVPVEGGAGERRFYSSQFMTQAYAALLLRKEGEPLRLIAETVRENSALYPRPLPLGAFEQPPFSLTREEILSCLRRMAGDDAYRDIARTRTSAGNEYVYSTAHLEADHAASLAEWIDVGQYDNP